MSRSHESLASNNALMAYTAAAMYAGAALDEVITGLLPGDDPTDPAPVLIAVVVAAALVRFGPRLPSRWLAVLGPIGVLLIAQALAGAPRAGDAAVLYLWPVVWSSFFLGRRGAVGIVATIALAHAAVLLSLPPGRDYPGRWFEVMFSVCVVAGVVVALGERNELLLAQLADDARVDALTGLLNRRGFEERASLVLERARREEGSVALASFDIDYFKSINDRWGHEVGDRVLERTGRVLEREAREIDVVARFGGEEFVVLLSGSDERTACAFAERVRDLLALPGDTGVPAVRMSVGIDAALAPGSISELHRNADHALYEAKRAGRDRTMAFDRGRSEPRSSSGVLQVG